MPRNQPNNRIQVDLKLLQDKNAEKLMAFGNQFGKSVDKLAVALADWNGQIVGANGMQGRSAGKSTTASTPGKVADALAGHPTTRTVGEARRRGPLPPPGENYGWDEPPAGVASVAQPLSQGGGGGPIPNDNEQEYVRAMRRIGEVPTTMRQMLGYMAESGKYHGEGDPRNTRDAKGNPTAWWNRSASRASDYMFAGQTVQRALQGHFAQMNNMTNAGMDVGYSREGGPFGLMSPAFREGLKNNLKSQWSSKFGFNPNYSTQQAAMARATVNQYGYGGDTADYMAERLKQLEIHQRLSPEASMRLLDPAVRFGNVEMSQLTDTLNAMPAAARAARMNLKDFGEQITSLATQISSNGSMSATAAAAQLSAFSATTGLSPEKGAAMLQDRNQTFMAMGTTGMSYAQATIGPNALAGRLKAPMMIGNQLAQSYGFKDMGALSQAYTDMQAGRKVSPAADAALSSLGMMIEAQPDLFGGMNLKELMNNARRGNVLGRTEAASQLTLLGDKATEQDYHRLIGLAGMGKKGQHGFDVNRAAAIRNIDKKDEGLRKLTGHGLTAAQRKEMLSRSEQAYLQSKFNEKSEKRGRKAATVTVGLSTEAQKLLKIMDKSEQNKGGSNQWGDPKWYGRKAMSAGKGALEDVPIAGGILDGLLGG